MWFFFLGGSNGNSRTIRGNIIVCGSVVKYPVHFSQIDIFFIPMMYRPKMMPIFSGVQCSFASSIFFHMTSTYLTIPCFTISHYTSDPSHFILTYSMMVTSCITSLSLFSIEYNQIKSSLRIFNLHITCCKDAGISIINYGSGIICLPWRGGITRSIFHISTWIAPQVLTTSSRHEDLPPYLPVSHWPLLWGFWWSDREVMCPPLDVYLGLIYSRITPLEVPTILGKVLLIFLLHFTSCWLDL